MRLLLDTNVLSEIRHPRGEPRVKRYYDSLDEDSLFISAMTIGELAKGILLAPHGNRRTELDSWLRGLERFFADRILAVDREVAHLWAELTARGQNRGTPIPMADGLIAATAIRHGLHVVTRNTGHFIDAGAFVVNPWEE
jgi:predicted nucleic acid-binding protein